jgi:hypothetical protein
MITTRAGKAILVVAFAILITACGDQPRVPVPEPDLTGTWKLIMPAGYEYEAEIAYMDRMRYRIVMEVTFGGVYEITHDTLRMLNPGNDGTRHYVWKIEDENSLLLVEAPTVGEVGSDYRGATLTR